MNVSCPACQASLPLRPPKPGRYTPKCPKCGATFALIADADGATTEPLPSAVETTGAFHPTAPTRPAPPAETTGDYTAPDPAAADTGAGDADATAAHTTPAKAEPSKPKAAPSELAVQLGGYEVERELGRGGMGAVYLARQVSLDRPVALKVMNPEWAEDPVSVARFAREAYAAAQLNHHNVVSIYDVGEDGGVHYFSMEFVEGKSLGQVLKKAGKLDPAAAVSHVLQAARGLKFAHDRGMVHRDVKPDNLMLNTEGLVKVADLGLVKTKGMTAADDRPGADGSGGVARSGVRSAIRSAASAEVTTAGAAMGSPAYMAPEQCRDAATVDARADVYSLGCSLFALLAGRPPFPGKSALEVIDKQVNEPPPPLKSVVPQVPDRLAAVVDKALRKDPAHRHLSMDEFIADLQDWQAHRADGPPRPTEQQIQSFEGLSRTLAAEPLSKLATTVGFALPLAGLGIGLVLLPVKTTVGAALLLAVVAGVLAGFVGAVVAVGGPLTRKAREWAATAGWANYLTAGLAAVLFVVGVVVAGLTVPALIALVAGAAAGVGWAFGLAGPAAGKRDDLKDELDGVVKRLRLAGVDEDAVRKFAAEAAGDRWEVVYETLFGYPAKLAARETHVGRPKHAAWRDGLIRKLDGAVEARRSAKAETKLAKLEAKRLEAEGLSFAEAKTRAAAAAADLVEQAAALRKANADRATKVDVRQMLSRYETAKLAELNRPRRSPVQAVTRLLSRTVFSPRLRLLAGALLVVGGLLWVRQNEAPLGLKAATAAGTVDQQQAVGLAKKLWAAGPPGGAKPQADKTKPLAVPGLPSPVAGLFDSVNPVAAGVLILLTALSGSLLCLATVGLSALVVLAGHKLGLPVPDDVAGMNPRQMVLAVGSVLGLVAMVVFGRR